MTIFAFTIFVGEATITMPAATATFCEPFAVKVIHAPTDRAAEDLAPELLSGGGIERIEVAAHVAEEHDASGRRSHTADDRVVGLQTPFPDASVGVDGIYPASPASIRTAEFAEHVERVPCHPDPWLPDRHRPKLFDALYRHRFAPLDLANEDEVRPGIIGRAAPLRAPHRARAEKDIVARRERCGDILDPGHRHAVELDIGGEIVAIEQSIFRRDRHQLLAAHRLDQDRRV
jgi:hypothetical protein